MSQSHRREFLQDVGGGMLAVLIGSSLASEYAKASSNVIPRRGISLTLARINATATIAIPS